MALCRWQQFKERACEKQFELIMQYKLLKATKQWMRESKQIPYGWSNINCQRTRVMGNGSRGCLPENIGKMQYSRRSITYNTNICITFWWWTNSTIMNKNIWDGWNMSCDLTRMNRKDQETVRFSTKASVTTYSKGTKAWLFIYHISII